MLKKSRNFVRLCAGVSSNVPNIPIVMKKLMVTVWLALLVSAVGAMFWYNELIYHLPTPIPGNYKPVSMGTLIN